MIKHIDIKDGDFICPKEEGLICDLQTDIECVITVIADKIDFLISESNNSLRYNYSYDTLIPETKNYLRDLMQVTLMKYTEKPECKECEKKVNQIFKSMLGLSEIQDKTESKINYEKKKKKFIKNVFKGFKLNEIGEENIDLISYEKLDVIRTYLTDEEVEFLGRYAILDERMTIKKISIIGLKLTIGDIDNIGINEILRMSDDNLCQFIYELENECSVEELMSQ